MTRKQRKSLPWRRLGYVILIIIKFGELLLWISRRIINALRSYIKYSKVCFIRYPNTSTLVKKKLSCASFFQPTSQFLDIWWKTLPWVWYNTSYVLSCGNEHYTNLFHSLSSTRAVIGHRASLVPFTAKFGDLTSAAQQLDTTQYPHYKSLHWITADKSLYCITWSAL